MGLSAAALAGVLPPFVQTLAAGGGATCFDTSALEERGVRCYADLQGPDTPALVDGLYFDAEKCGPEAVAGELRLARLRVHRNGTLFILGLAAEWATAGEESPLARLGLGLYRRWSLEGDTLASLEIGEAPKNEWLLLQFHRTAYDPVLHAHTYLREKNFYVALGILLNTPDHWLKTEEQRGLHAAERLACYLAQDRHAGERHRMLHLVSALHAYTRTCTYIPSHVPPYLYMAAFWKVAGREDLGRRLLQTVATIVPDPDVTLALEKYQNVDAPEISFRYPAFDPGFPLRILYLTHADSDYGADLLYDGLRRVLGAENVIEHPWKPTLHGQNLDRAFGYPCTFQWPDGPRDLTEIVRMAGEGAFDAILFSDTFSTLPREQIQPILEAAPEVPLFIVDTWDECGNYIEEIRQHSGLRAIAGCFKREMVAGLDYGPNAWPLNFAYADDRLPESPSWDGRAGAFFAGKLIGGARRLQMTWLNQVLPINGSWGTPYTQAEYVALLREQLIGLCLFGNGFDTVRYWELPAHGVMLMAERSPLVIPNNFVDGKQAVFFDHAGELKEKLAYYLAHPKEAAEIAQAGHAHLLEYHTSTARARQFLGKLQEQLRR